MVVKQRAAYPDKWPPRGPPAALEVALPQNATANGIEVYEERWGAVTVLHMYAMRCECGCPWFERDLPRFIRYPPVIS
jgi:hypothetical protein